MAIARNAVRRTSMGRMMGGLNGQNERPTWVPDPPSAQLCRQLYEEVSGDGEYEAVLDEWTCKWLGRVVRVALPSFASEDIYNCVSEYLSPERGQEILAGQELTVAEAELLKDRLETEAEIALEAVVAQYTTRAELKSVVHYLQFFGDWGEPLGWQGPWIGSQPEMKQYLSAGRFLVFEGFWFDHLGRCLELSWNPFE